MIQNTTHRLSTPSEEVILCESGPGALLRNPAQCSSTALFRRGGSCTGLPLTARTFRHASPNAGTLIQKGEGEGLIR